MSTILITGGAGFIGSNFVKYMLNKYSDYDIINLDALTYCGNLENLKDIEDITKIVIAYEPVWAIGTGKTATAEQANETIGFIRKTVGEMFCPKCADALRIQYGGSMNAGNCKELMAMPEIDGGLIGGASLKAPDFAAIVNFDK